MYATRVAVIALVIVVTAAGCSKPTADELFARGNEYFAKEMIPEAIVQYRLAAQAEPNRGDIRTKLADAYLLQRDGQAALRETVIAADLQPTDLTSQVRAGNLLLLAGAFEDAKTRAQKALALDPKNADALVLMGNALAGLKDLDGALSEYREALTLNPGRDQVYANIGAIHFARGQVSEAEATFRKAVEVAPKSVAARLALAGFLWASQRQADAEGVLREALQLEPANLVANRALGTFLVATGRAPAAEPFFKAIADTTKADEAQLSLADYYIVLRRFDDAKAILTPLSQQQKSFAAASLRLAAIEETQNNRSGAATIVNAVLARMPKNIPARVANMRLLLADNRLDDALAAARAIIKDEPGGAPASEAHFVAGTIEAGRDRNDEALRSFAEALRLQPQSLPATLALAQLHLRLGNADKAETYARQILAARPTDFSGRAVLVRVALIRNNLPDAIRGLASLEKEFPDSVPVLNLGAARDAAVGRLDAARAKYLKAVASAPGDLEALEGLVLLDIRAGKHKESAERVEDALRRLPASANLYVVAARAHFAGGNLARAEELLKQAVEREPARLVAYSLLGELYVRQKRLADARNQYEELLKKHPQSIAGNTMLGMILEALGDLPAAEQQYQRTLGIDPAAPVAANNLAWLMVASNRNLDQALQLAQTAVRGLPEEPHVNDTLGWIYYRKGLYSQALRHLELSVARDPNDPTSQYHLGMAYLQREERDKARKALEKALSSGSPFDGIDDARKALADLRR